MFNRSKGFTLVELMITLAIAAIVLAIAIPSFNTQMMNSRSAALGEDFATAMNYARVEAVSRRARVSVCASDDRTNCNTTDWRAGFIAFVDDVASDTATPPVVNTANILRVWQAVDERAVITVTQGGAASFVRFTGTGALARISANPAIINVAFTNCTNDAARTITVGMSGLVSVARANCP